MDYKNKYLKYKNKYLQIKNTQLGSGPQSHKKIVKEFSGYRDELLGRIGTFENARERESRETARREPEKGYKIFESIGEIIEYNYGLDPTYELTDEQIMQRIAYMDLVTGNLGDTFGASFEFVEAIDRDSKLMYIDSRGDGNCFLNSLFIYSLMSNKADKIRDLSSISGVRESSRINFANFRESMLFLGDSFLDNSGLDSETITQLKAALRDPNIPDTQSFGQVYVDNFNTRIIVVQVDKDYGFKNITGQFDPGAGIGSGTGVGANASASARVDIRDKIDHLVIIQKENIHFGLLIPYHPMNIRAPEDLERELSLRMDIRRRIYEHFATKVRTR